MNEGAFGPVFKSSTVVLLRHFATVFGFIPAHGSASRAKLGVLYCCSDGVRDRGAPVTYLSHTISFHANERIAPSNPGINHLEGHLQLRPVRTDESIDMFREKHAHIQWACLGSAKLVLMKVGNDQRRQQDDRGGSHVTWSHLLAFLML